MCHVIYATKQYAFINNNTGDTKWSNDWEQDYFNLVQYDNLLHIGCQNKSLPPAACKSYRAVVCVFVFMCYFGLIWRAARGDGGREQRARDAGHGSPWGWAGIQELYQAFLSLRTAALFSPSLHFSLSVAMREFGSGTGGRVCVLKR